MAVEDQERPGRQLAVGQQPWLYGASGRGDSLASLLSVLSLTCPNDSGVQGLPERRSVGAS